MADISELLDQQFQITTNTLKALVEKGVTLKQRMGKNQKEMLGLKIKVRNEDCT